MMKFRNAYISAIIFLLSFVGFSAYAQTVNLNAAKLIPHIEVSLSPSSGSFTEGSTFEVPIIINTKGFSVNSIEMRVNYDKDKLAMISSSNGVSIIGIWVEPPKYDNTRGTASYVGVVPNGITTGSGFVGIMTFKALRTGRAVVSISANSKILLNDGLGTETILDLRRSEYTIVPKAPEGVNIFSETHPFQNSWYNNNSPVISWEKDSGVNGFSFVLDNKPSTIPDNEINITETTKYFEKLGDGLWYFHIKAIKGGVWGTTGHFLMQIDTAPPAEFKPEINYIVAATLVERGLVSFLTTDNLSGIDRYEVGAIDKSQPITESPVFMQSESPFQVPLSSGGNLVVIVRAIDKAGNVRDASADIKIPLFITKFIKGYPIYILIFIISIGLVGLIVIIARYLFRHHIVKNDEQPASPKPPQP
ncbi:MAG: hypothetical protein UT61_C0036G0006 [Candidatus Woesebacteria bacterium GW2011_GWA1_39_8]|uniref:Uncharacterized protein n=1 Tax=Candidatus Woesebacteria bacterium GW2011_GWA1_39_8 TaxID=1618552 RepID=A0A0G0S3A3_9BACT|nr:MAG: hypothetical protein UT61_C0036G0006 [Candidatus Woesebacteria bacterium GW2011_GWA1_39_8]